jgi:hypothetical protein
MTKPKVARTLTTRPFRAQLSEMRSQMLLVLTFVRDIHESTTRRRRLTIPAAASLQHATPPPTHLSSDAPPPVRTAPNTPGYDALLLTDGSTVAQKESEAGTTMPVGFTPPYHYTPVSELVPVIAQFPLPITSTLSDSTTSTSSYPSSAPTSPESFDSGAKAGIIASSVSAAIGLASPTTAAPTVTNLQARGAPPSNAARPPDTPSAPSQSGKASAAVGRKPSLRRTLNASTVSGAKDTTSVEHKQSLFRRIRTKLAGGAGVAR